MDRDLDSLIILIVWITVTLTAVNLCVSGYFLFRRRQTDLRGIFHYWLALAASVAIVGLSEGDPTIATFACYASAVLAERLSIGLVATISGFGALPRWHSYWHFGALIVATALFFGDARFEIWAFVLMSGAVTPAIWLVYRRLACRRPESRPICDAATVVLTLYALHMMDYPFLRNDPEIAPYGYLVATLLIVALGLLLPAVVWEQRDFMEKARLNAEVEARTRELETALHTKSLLVRSVVHDLGNDLTVVKGVVRGDFGAFDEGARDRVRRAIGRIERLVDNVRTWESMERGRIQTNVEPVLVASLLNEIDDLFRSTAAHRGIDFIVRDATPRGARCLCDRDVTVTNVLANAVSNALKFTPRGGSVAIEAESLGGGRCRLTVRDDGMGFDEASLKPGVGSGFGIPIAKALTQAMGGEISFGRAGEGRGTVVAVSLPGDV